MKQGKEVVIKPVIQQEVIEKKIEVKPKVKKKKTVIKKCPKCGGRVSKNAVFCPKCGKALKKKTKGK